MASVRMCEINLSTKPGSAHLISSMPPSLLPGYNSKPEDGWCHCAHGEEGKPIVAGREHDLRIQGAQNKRQWSFPVSYKLSLKREANPIKIIIMSVVCLTLAQEGNKITHPVSLKNRLPS